MKKLLISLSAIAMLVAGATVASAAPSAGFVVDYNEALSSPLEAVVDIYLPCETTDTFTSLSGKYIIYEGSTVVTSEYVTSGTYTSMLKTSATLDSSQYNAQSQMSVAFAGSASTGLASMDESGHIGRFVLTLSKPLTNALSFGAPSSRGASSYNMGSGAVTCTNSNEYDTIKTLSATLSGTTENTDTGSDPATYFTVDATAVSGATPYWYATIAGNNKKTAVTTTPNISGNVRLGLVYTGEETLTNVKLVWE